MAKASGGGGSVALMQVNVTFAYPSGDKVNIFRFAVDAGNGETQRWHMGTEGNMFRGCPCNVRALRLRIACAPSLLPLLLLLTLPAVVRAQFTYTTNDGTITITGYTATEGDVTIPYAINGLPVASIGAWAFYSTTIASVTIPDGVTNIADGAFFDCQSLTHVTLGDRLTTIGEWAFAFCSGLTGAYFRGNAPSLQGGNVFYGDSATVYYVPGTTGWGATFGGRPTGTWIPPYTYTINNGTITILYYNGPGGAVTIPGTINDLPVTSIGFGAFRGLSSLTSVTIPNSVTNILPYAFQGTGLLSVTIPDSVTTMGDFAFQSCSSLTNVIIGNNVTTIPWWGFGYCFSLASVTLGDRVTTIGASAFQDCNLTSITFPSSLSTIGRDSFYHCTSLTGMYFKGNAPSVANGISTFANTTAYYLPGTTGWGSTLAFVVTALWELPYPLILSSSPSFGVVTNQFGFTVSWATNLSVVVEASTNLSNPVWEPLQTNTLSGGSFYFSDSQWTNHPTRFYRLRWP